MADEIIVGMYDSRREAEEARERLIAQGVAADHITIEQGAAPGEVPMSPGDRVAMHEVGEPLPEDRGVSGFIARMFSGALMDNANIEQYTEALGNGRCLLAVRVDSDVKRHAVSTVLARGGPRTYSLPNAPTAWNEASANDPASIGGVDADPARPEGLLTDAKGLPAQADETRLSNAPRTRRNR
jgi:hypothetical protein